jgi:hypothetical protein
MANTKLGEKTPAELRIDSFLFRKLGADKIAHSRKDKKHVLL